MEGIEVINTMMKNDYFSQWLGIKILEQKTGYVKIKMTVRKDMLNGFGIAHGGISYSLADSALAFASNNNGIKSVSIETSISHLTKLNEHNEIVAEAECEHQSEKLGQYKVKVYLNNPEEKLIALFRGTVYKSSKHW